MKTNVSGYLPNDRPPFGQLVLLGLQHVLTMFPTAAVVGIVMNLVFTAFKPSAPPRVQPKVAIP
jgi:xanthine/uracil permease